MSKKAIIIICVVAFFIFIGVVSSCSSGDEDGGATDEKSFIIECSTEMMAGDRIEITIKKSYDFSMNHSDYTWIIVDNINTVGGEFVFEDLDPSDNYTNKFFKATTPGKVKIQAKNTTSGELYSNVVEITVKGYEIKTVEDLKALKDSEKGYTLMNDLDLSGIESWEPITGFKGGLDGNGHKITGLKIDVLNTKDVGLFGVLEGSVKNLTIENAKISGRGDAGNAGILAGTAKGKLDNVNVSGEISLSYYDNVGGVVGFCDGGNLVNCVNNASVAGANKVGGVCGNAVIDETEAVKGCANAGSVFGREQIGGVVGYITCVRSNLTHVLSSNKNLGEISGTNSVGGLFGEVYGFYERYSYTDYYSYFELSVSTNEGRISSTATGSYTGGLVGKATKLATITTCENKADISGGNYVGGFVGYAPDTAIKANGTKNNNTITGKGKVGGFAGECGVVEGAVNNGEIVSTGVFVEDGKSRAYVGGIAGYCAGIIDCVNNADITVEGNGDFVGGIAGYIKVSADGNLKNNINNGSVTGYNCVGGVAGYLTSVRSNVTYVISNSQNKGAVAGHDCVGGLFGEIYGFYERYSYTDYYSRFEMSLLTNEGQVTGNAVGSYTGGLAGKGSYVSIITTCDNKADIVGGNYVGGFVGYSPDTNIKATGAKNNCAVTGSTYVGGFAGYAGVIEYAENNGQITVTGVNEEGQSVAGGIAGYCTGAIGCVNNADIATVNGCRIGGIAGYMVLSTENTVYDNVNNGAISGDDYIGGIVGYATCVRSNISYKINNNQNRGAISGDCYVSGIAGFVKAFYERYSYTDYNSYFEITNCMNDGDVTGSIYVGGICGGYERLKTDANLMDTNITTVGQKLGQ